MRMQSLVVCLVLCATGGSAAADADTVWEEGFYSVDRTWVPGFWRQRERKGFVWIESRREDRVWVRPYWKPKERREPFVWVTGSPGPNGWIHGFWRLPYLNETGWIDHRPIVTRQVIVAAPHCKKKRPKRKVQPAKPR